MEEMLDDFDELKILGSMTQAVLEAIMQDPSSIRTCQKNSQSVRDYLDRITTETDFSELSVEDLTRKVGYHCKMFHEEYGVVEDAARKVGEGNRNYDVLEVAKAIILMRYCRDVIKKACGVD
jgi:hypothetical protein